MDNESSNDLLVECMLSLMETEGHPNIGAITIPKAWYDEYVLTRYCPYFGGKDEPKIYGILIFPEE